MLIADLRSFLVPLTIPSSTNAYWTSGGPSVSRAAHDAQIFPNDAATLATALSHDATKTSAVTIGQATSGGIERDVGPPPATDIGAGFSL
jgi:hypothetical protein